MVKMFGFSSERKMASAVVLLDGKHLLYCKARGSLCWLTSMQGCVPVVLVVVVVVRWHSFSISQPLLTHR